MFTQKISMKCTKEQYEKYLKDDLLEMGYIESNLLHWDLPDYSYITNNYCFGNGKIGNTNITCIISNNRTYLGEFNADLFLALAAMTDVEDGCYGEWWYILNKNCECFTHGNLYKGLSSILNYGSFVDNMGERNGFSLHGTSKIFNNLRKATVEEIMEYFKPKEEDLIPEKGKYYYCKCKNNGKWLFISNGVNKHKTDRVASVNLRNLTRVYTEKINNYITVDSDIKFLRLATQEERAILNKALLEQEKYFNPVTNTIDSVITTSIFNISPVIEYSTPEESAIELLKSKGYIITKQF